MKQIVYPIKDSNVLSEVQPILLHNFRWGRRNLNINYLGTPTMRKTRAYRVYVQSN